MNNNISWEISNPWLMPIIKNDRTEDDIELKKFLYLPKFVIAKIVENVIIRSKFINFFEVLKNMQLVNKAWYRGVKQYIEIIRKNKIEEKIWKEFSLIKNINFKEICPNIEFTKIPLGISFFKNLKKLDISKKNY